MVEPAETALGRWLAAADAGDLDAFDEILREDAIVHAGAGLVTNGVEEQKVAWRSALDRTPGLRHDVLDLLTDGNVEMARVVVSGTMAGSFAGVDGGGWQFRVDQALIAHLWVPKTRPDP
jgi:predicted ester cyclase